MKELTICASPEFCLVKQTFDKDEKPDSPVKDGSRFYLRMHDHKGYYSQDIVDLFNRVYDYYTAVVSVNPRIVLQDNSLFMSAFQKLMNSEEEQIAFTVGPFSVTYVKEQDTVGTHVVCTLVINSSNGKESETFDSERFVICITVPNNITDVNYYDKPLRDALANIYKQFVAFVNNEFTILMCLRDILGITCPIAPPNAFSMGSIPPWQNQMSGQQFGNMGGTVITPMPASPSRPMPH